ncbi:conserved hypothetical protein [Syntrophaceticus schinkii]|uniref:Uncharacterized protein n=1 Tax=Syntrophaceticus schinkii TaxID=499207 RepID=A0A0B7MJJ6_9FIRM|nr:conserved hypothetical protein [Syntrophaceticus schinkii]
MIAAMYLFVMNSLYGSRLINGLKYGLSCCVIWVVYLLEPLPHVAPIDKFTYPLADGITLIILPAFP